MTSYRSDIPPRERMVRAGPSTLSDAELIALLVGTGRAGENVFELSRLALDRLGGLRALAESHPSEVMTLPGLGVAKAARIFAAVEIGRRICGQKWNWGEPFCSSRQVFAHYHYLLRDEKREFFFAIYLDARNRLIADMEISRGSLVASIVHPREVFRPAIRLAAASVICVHNHPSGEPSSSREDEEITRRLYDAGETVGIQLLDHIIVGDGHYFSFLDAGVAPFVPNSAAIPGRRGARPNPPRIREGWS